MPSHTVEALQLYLYRQGYDILHAAHVGHLPASESVAVVTCDGKRRVTLTIEPGEATDTIRIVDPATLAQRQGSIGERMRRMLEEEPGRVAWSARKWADALGCTPGAVHATPSWRRIMTVRAFNRAERIERGK